MKIYAKCGSDMCGLILDVMLCEVRKNGIMRLAISLAGKGEIAERITHEVCNMSRRFHLLARVKSHNVIVLALM